MFLVFLINLFIFRYPIILCKGYVIEEFITADKRLMDKY